VVIDESERKMIVFYVLWFELRRIVTEVKSWIGYNRSNKLYGGGYVPFSEAVAVQRACYPWEYGAERPSVRAARELALQEMSNGQ